MPARTVPEPHHFLKSWEYAKGLEAYLDEWFTGASNETAVGEKSSSYIFGGQTVAERIQRDLPDIRIIVTLRDPVERTWAHYRFTALNGLENLNFDDALRMEAERIAEQKGQWAEIQPFNYTGRSFYARQLQPFMETFGRDRILILKSEMLQANPTSTFERVFHFLGVETKFAPVPVAVHRSADVKSAAEQAKCRTVFGDRFGAVLKSVRSATDPFVHACSAEEKQTIEQLRSNLSPEIPEMSDWARNYLSGLFRQDLAILRDMVEFDIEDWRH